MKTKQTIVTALSSLALSSFALSVFAGGFPGNPERDVIDQTLGTSIIVGGDDGWKDFGAERGVVYVGGGTAPTGGGHAYSKEDMLQARMDYREASN